VNAKATAVEEAAVQVIEELTGSVVLYLVEHLRKEAKAVLRVFGRHQRGWRLADAQHAVARGYGFAHWSKLKAYVESAAPRPASEAESTQEYERVGVCG
jgi:hypothetical protein